MSEHAWPWSVRPSLPSGSSTSITREDRPSRLPPRPSCTTDPTASPPTRPWPIDSEGVLLAQGGRTGGFAFFVKERRLHFVYNYLGRDMFEVHSTEDIPTGDVSLRYEFEPTGEPDLAVGKGSPGSVSSTSTSSW